MYTDVEYLKKADELKELAETGSFIYFATRKNMNRLISWELWNHLRKRNIIETGWGIMKQIFFLEYHQAKCISSICFSNRKVSR